MESVSKTVPVKSVIDPNIGIWLKDIGNMKAVKLSGLHKKKINYVYGIEGDAQFVTGSKDGTGKVFTFAEGTQKKVLFAREVGARCGTAFRTERIIAVSSTIINSTERMITQYVFITNRMQHKYMKYLMLMMILLMVLLLILRLMLLLVILKMVLLNFGLLLVPISLLSHLQKLYAITRVR